MKLYIGDYLGDTSHLTTLQHGAYLLLIMAYWQKGGCIRNADAMLRQCTRTTELEWQECRETILEFFEDREGFLYHHRIDKELHKRADISSKSKFAADARWCGRNADAMPTHSGRNATPIVHIPDNNIINNQENADAMPTHKHKYGKEKNVILTDEQYKGLVDDLGESMAIDCIEELSSAKAMKGYKYKRDDLAIRKWVIDAVARKPIHSPTPVIPVKPKIIPTCKACGSTDLAPSWCRTCHWDFIQDPEQWLIENPIEARP
jgi:uncharacterized protein YdaU (DUF1376 family)